MRRVKIAAAVILLLLVVIQFIRPERNSNSTEQPANMVSVMPVPEKVQALLTTACYDCHSNNTHYPWYMNIQPVAWLMANHIKDGKAELNFDEFATYSRRRQTSKLQSIANSLKDGSMPLSSYTWMHKEARLSDQDKQIIINWALQQKDSLETRN